jgi:hypothetical protein
MNFYDTKVLTLVCLDGIQITGLYTIITDWGVGQQIRTEPKLTAATEISATKDIILYLSDIICLRL